MIYKDLQGKTVMLTGATSMLGEQIALKMAKNGAKLILQYNDSVERINYLENKLKEIGTPYIILKADFNNHEDFKKIIIVLKKQRHAIDVLINNAAIDISKLIVTVNDENFDHLMNVNLRAPYFLIKHVLHSMVTKRSGCIVNVSSCITKRSKMKGSLYGASKGGLEAVTKILAKEVGCFNIRINAVAPGPFISQMNRMDDVQIKMIQQCNAIPKLVSLEEISNVVLFLSSNLSSGITGQVIVVDNGFSI